MAVDPRPIMTSAFFEGEASYRDAGSVFTGESFIYRDPVMQIDGWNVYGSPGFNCLTEPQQALMVWGDLVGQTYQNGFVLFVMNMKGIITRTHHTIPKFEWPELTERFNRALIEQVGDPLSPKVWEPVWEARNGIEELINEDDAPLDNEAEEFDRWFYQEQTEKASMEFIGGYVRRHRDELCRIVN